MQIETIETPGGFVRATGTEARVCQMIAQRQALGREKYGTTVEQNQWLQRMANAGYCAIWADDFDSAREQIMMYLSEAVR